MLVTPLIDHLQLKWRARDGVVNASPRSGAGPTSMVGIDSARPIRRRERLTPLDASGEALHFHLLSTLHESKPETTASASSTALRKPPNPLWRRPEACRTPDPQTIVNSGQLPIEIPSQLSAEVDPLRAFRRQCASSPPCKIQSRPRSPRQGEVLEGLAP